MQYDAFISYSHAADHRLAPELQSALHGFAKPWYRLRAIHTFRDKTSLAATPKLWGTIQQALEASRYFVLLASPEAAASPWVRQEVLWWLAHRSADTLLIIVTGGAVKWAPDTKHFDAAVTTALPEPLHRAFAEEPLHVDLSWAQHAKQLSLRDGRFGEAVARLSAAVRGCPLDELAGEDVRQHRIFRATASAAVTGLAVLTVAAAVGAYLAVLARSEAQAQRDVATTERNIAQSELLASDAERTAAIRPNNQEEATLVALAALNRHPTVRANQVLRGLAARLLPPYGVMSRDESEAEMDFSVDGKLQAVIDTPGTIRIFDAASGKTMATIERQPVGRDVPDRADRPSLGARGIHVVAPEGEGWLSAWQARTGKRVARFRTGPIAHFVLSPDETHIALLARDTLRLAELRPGGLSVPLMRDKALTEVMRFSPDGRWLVARGQNGDAHVWRVDSWEKTRVLRHAGGFDPMAFSADGAQLATVGDESVIVWRLADGAVQRSLPLPKEEGVEAIALHPDGEHLALGSRDENWVVVRHLPSRREVSRVMHDSPLVRDLAFSADGRYLASAGADHTARVWDWAARSEVARTVHQSQVGAVAFIADDNVLLSTGTATPTRAWRLRAPVMRRALGPTGSETRDVDFSPDGQRVASGGGDGVVRIIDLAEGTALPGPPDHGAFCGSRDDRPDTGVRFSPDGRLLATACSGKVYLWNTQSWALSAQIAEGQPAQRLAFSPDGRWLAVAGNAGFVSIYTADGRTRVARFDVVAATWSLDFSADGRHLVAASGGLTGKGQAVVWDLREGRIARAIDRPGTVHAAVFSHDGKWLLTGSADGVATLSDMASGRTLATFRHDGNVYAVALDADATHAITASADGSVRVWHVADQRLVREMLHSDIVSTIALSPDGRYLVTGGHDSQTHVWRLADGREMAREQHTGPITRVAFSPGDGRYVAGVGHQYKHPGLVWMWRDEDLRAQAQQRATRTLTAQERARYLPAAEAASSPKPTPRPASAAGAETVERR